MDQETIWKTLERLGAIQRGHFKDGDQHADIALGAFDALTDPVATDSLAGELSELAGRDAPDVILAMHVWTALSGLLVAFRAGVKLGKPIISLSDEEGIIRGSRPLNAGGRAVLIGEVFTQRDVSLARAQVEQAGASLVDVVALIEDGRAEGVRGLISFASHRHPIATCPMCRDGHPLTESMSRNASTRS
jgi:hypothetical protein